jgi:hypothetical protein
MQLNVKLCEELKEFKVNIYSFPMKYHPITDPEYFRNRHYLGEHWNRKFIRAIQAVLNCTKGKVGKGSSFFNHAFGEDLQEFHKILYMPEAFIIYRVMNEKKEPSMNGGKKSAIFQKMRKKHLKKSLKKTNLRISNHCQLMKK